MSAARPDLDEVCICGHDRRVHGFGEGRCWPCEMSAQWADEECDWFRLTADSPGRPR